MTKLPSSMNADEIVKEIKLLHGGIEQSAIRMGELCKHLLLKARPATVKAASEGDRRIAGASILYANAWLRLSGLVVQAVRRNHIADRTLDAEHRSVEESAREAVETERREARAKARAERKAALFGGAANADLMELYGKEMVNDATRK